MRIASITAREILDSRGNPTIEADVVMADGSFGRAMVPSGASTGQFEALELRDGDEHRYFGQGVLKAVANVKNSIAPALINKDIADHETLDKIMLELDGTENKSKLGANAILSVSLAVAWAESKSQKKQLFEYIGDLYGNQNFVYPRPMFNIMNGGKHADWATDIQEYMVIPTKVTTWAESLRIGSEIYHALEKLLKGMGLSINVGNEGGFAPAVKSNKEAVDLILQAIEKAGYKPGEEVSLGFDAAASEFYNPETKMYDLKRDGVSYTSDQMVDWAMNLANQYPIITMEDMLSENDWSGWQNLTAKIGDRMQLVGDDLLVTNVKKVARAIEEKTCNSLLVKFNQIGSLTETLAAMKMAKEAGWNNVVSHRSGETEDVTIAHLAVGTASGQLKSGALSRSERTAKFNELLRIEEYLLK